MLNHMEVLGGNSIPSNVGSVGASGGGAGNPAGTARHDNDGSHQNINAENGCGGLMLMFCNSISKFGNINSNGSPGGYVYRSYAGVVTQYSGGSSGGGSINIFAKSILEKDNFNCSALGGTRSGVPTGGSGTVTIGTVTNGQFQKIDI